VPTAYDSFLNPGTLVWLSGESVEKGTRDLKRAQTLCSLLIQACSTKSRMTQRSCACSESRLRYHALIPRDPV
jgi:hypothetical protein